MRITQHTELPAPNQPAISGSPVSETPAVPDVSRETLAEPVKQDGDLTSRYQKLARKTQFLRSRIQERERALRDREESLKAREAEIEDYKKSYVPRSRVSELFNQDPTVAMREFNVNGDSITQGLLNQPSQEQRMIMELKNELAALKGEVGQTRQSMTDKEQKDYEQALSLIRTDVTHLIDSSAEFSTIKAMNAQDEVVNLIEEVFKNGWPGKKIPKGHILSNEEAAQAIEAQLIEDLVKAAQLEKIQLKLKALTSPKPAEMPAQNLPGKPLHSTLAKAQTTTSNPRTTDEKARLARAIAAMEGRLTA